MALFLYLCFVVVVVVVVVVDVLLWLVFNLSEIGIRPALPRRRGFPSTLVGGWEIMINPLLINDHVRDSPVTMFSFWGEIKK